MKSWRRHTWITLLTGGLLCLFGVANAPVPNAVTITEFELRGYRANGDLDWVLRGEQAAMAGNRVSLEQVQGRFYEIDEEYHIATPTCLYDKQSKRARGEDRIEVRGKAVLMRGEGFDLDAEKHRIFIRRNVHIQIFKSTVDLLGKSSSEE